VSWVTSAWHVVFTVMLGAGAGIVAFVVLRIYAAPKVPADKAAARDELELGVRRVINCNMLLMEACRDLAESCRRMPPEYQHIAEHTLRFAKLMEEATYEEGVSERIFPRPLFNAGDGVPVPEPRPAAPTSVTLMSPEDLQLPPEALTSDQLHRGHWVAGQLIPR
jgi:hypothetical protein